MSGILTALHMGELMTAEELTWQAASLFIVLIAIGAAGAAFLVVKAVQGAALAYQMWKNALK